MVENKNGLSLEFIIHPGETLKEIIEDRGMSQKELALRTGISAKHVSDVVNCLKPISVDFAKKLEYALGIDASFWINLQANYSKEIADFEEKNRISNSEKNIVKKLQNIVQHFEESGFIKKDLKPEMKVIELRKKLNISSLEDIPRMFSTGAYRVATLESADPHILFAWLRMSELYTNSDENTGPLDIDMLIEKIPKMKKLMFDASELIEGLKKIFAECGIRFAIVPHFRGAPVQGVIKRDIDGRMSLIMTIRQKFADIFWFTLMHEIGHIVNGDIKKRLIDYNNHSGLMEDKADTFAKNQLLDPKMYSEFLRKEDFSMNSINDLAKRNDVHECIVIGRLQKEGFLEYTQYSMHKLRYEWKKN